MRHAILTDAGLEFVYNGKGLTEQQMMYEMAISYRDSMCLLSEVTVGLLPRQRTHHLESTHLLGLWLSHT